MTATMLPVRAEKFGENHWTGLQAMTEDRRDELMKHTIIYNDFSIYSNLSSVDNSNTEYFSSIANQGMMVCVDYATTYYLS